MTRARSAPKKKSSGGLLRGMRSGVQRAVGAESEAPKKSKTANLVWNIVTVVLVLVTAAILLRRFGLIHF